MVMPSVAKLDCLMRVIRDAEDLAGGRAVPPARENDFIHGIEARPTFSLTQISHAGKLRRVEHGGQLTKAVQRAITQH